MDKFLCLDCKVDTSEIYEYYMVKDEIWPIGTYDGMLCIGCLETRIGRELNVNDFPFVNVNCNWFSPHSERLESRLAGFFTVYENEIRKLEKEA